MVALGNDFKFLLYYLQVLEKTRAVNEQSFVVFHRLCTDQSVGGTLFAVNYKGLSRVFWCNIEACGCGRSVI